MSAASLRGRPKLRPPAISFEFFPPKSDAQAELLDETVARLRRFRPNYVSVTYGAGGTSQERSLGTVRRMHESGLATAAHLTCAGATRDALAHTIGLFREVGIERFVALRGDPPGGLTVPYEPHPLGYRDTAQLVETLKLAGATEVSVSAYPERHPQSADWDAEIGALKRKVDAGADRAITQFFYDNDLFERYRRARPPRRHRYPDRAGHHADPPLRVDLQFRQPLRRDDPGKPGAPLRWARSGSGDARARRGGGRGRADGGPDRARRRRVPHLHAEPGRAHRSDLPGAGRGSPTARREPPPAPPEAARAQRTPKTIAPRKMKAAQTATKFSGLMKVIGWPPSASCGAY